MGKESPSSSHHRRESLSSSSQGYKSSKSESKPIRDGAIKGLTDALTLKLSKNTDVKIEEDKLEDLVKTIEHDLYAFYSRDVGNKYRAKYRSLVFNIKDEKNNGLFRKIINGTIAPKKLVEMSPDDMANKELKEWRHAELKGDIEKIKSHELDLLKLGTKIVVKSHKGEEVREQEKTTEIATIPVELIMPDKKKSESKSKSDDSSYRAYKKIKSSKTWDHDKHDSKKSESCDVCNGRLTKEELADARIEREKRRKERSKSSSKHKNDKSSSSRSSKDSKSRSHRSHSKERSKSDKEKILQEEEE